MGNVLINTYFFGVPVLDEFLLANGVDKFLLANGTDTLLLT